MYQSNAIKTATIKTKPVNNFPELGGISNLT